MAEFVRRVKGQINPVCIILFGSAARGMDGIWSDLDIIIIGGSLPNKIIERQRALAHLKVGLSAAIDTFPYTESEFDRMLSDAHLMALECMDHGIPLHGEEYFGRLRIKFNALVAQGWRRLDYGWKLSRAEKA